MNSQNEELSPTPSKWTSDDDTISNYGHYGAILGAVLGFGIALSGDLHCRIIKNSQGCGAESVGQALFFYGLMIVLTGGLALYAGREIGKQHPSFRWLCVICYASIFFFQFGWTEILEWLRPELKETFWGKSFGLWALIATAIFYFSRSWHLKRKLKR